MITFIIAIGTPILVQSPSCRHSHFCIRQVDLLSAVKSPSFCYEGFVILATLEP